MKIFGGIRSKFDPLPVEMYFGVGQYLWDHQNRGMKIQQVSRFVADIPARIRDFAIISAPQQVIAFLSRPDFAQFALSFWRVQIQRS